MVAMGASVLWGTVGYGENNPGAPDHSTPGGDTVTAGRSETTATTLEGLAAGQGARRLGDSIVSRVAEREYIVCPLLGQECQTVKNPTEVYALVERQKESVLGASGKPVGLTISDLLEQVKAEVAKDYTFDVEEWRAASRDSKKLTKKVKEINDIEEGFSTKLEKIFKSPKSNSLNDKTKWLLTSLLFSERAAFISEKLKPLVLELKEKNAAQRDPRIDALTRMLIDKKEGFLGAYQEAYQSAQKDRAASAALGTVFNSVGCPSCLIQRELEPSLLSQMGLARKQLPQKTDDFTTQDGQTFVGKNGESYVVFKAPNQSIALIDPNGVTKYVDPKEPVQTKLSAKFREYQNNPRPKPPEKNVAATLPTQNFPTTSQGAWSGSVAVTNEALKNSAYTETLQKALKKPTALEAAKTLFNVGLYVEKGSPEEMKQHQKLMQELFNDPRFDEAMAKKWLHKYLTASGQFSHCPSCWIAAQGGWTPRNILNQR